MFDYEEIKETIELLVEMSKESEFEGDFENAKFYMDEAFKLAEKNLSLKDTLITKQ
jgi:hypothetical protein